MTGGAPRQRAIIIVDHGSRLATANDQLADVAALVAASAPEVAVAFAHMELAPPSLDEAVDRLAASGVEEITVHPYMLGPGRHSTDDIPRLTRRAAERWPGVRFRITEPLGVDARLAAVILDRVADARDLTNESH